jgi:hypothetical protein
MKPARPPIVIVPEYVFTRSAGRLAESIEQMADAVVWSPTVFLRRALSLSSEAAVVFLGDVPGAGLMRIAATTAGGRFSASWGIRGRVAAVRFDRPRPPHSGQVEDLHDYFENELENTSFGEVFYRGLSWASLGPACASRFLSEAYADPEDLPGLPNLPFIRERRRWLHMGIAAFIADELSDLLTRPAKRKMAA